MTKTTLSRTGVSQWSVNTDLWPGRAGWNNELAALNTRAAVYGQGLMASRPASSISGFYYWATDTQRLWYDTGTGWIEVSPIGGGGTPQAVTIGAGGSEGTSRIGARADHTHPLADPAVDPAAVTYGGSAARGSSATVARADHSHALAQLPFAGTSAAPLAVGGSGAVGVATSLARADHGHTLPAPDADPGVSNPGQGANRGVSTTVARADHQHAVPALPIATAAAPPAQIDVGDAAAVGVSTSLARADHQHALPAPASAPPGVGYGQSGGVGSATTVARSDHTHSLAQLPYSDFTPWDLYPGAVGPGTSPYLSRHDHQHAYPTQIIAPAGGPFTGNTPPHQGLWKLYCWHTIIGTNANGDLTIPHTGFVNGSMDPQSVPIDPNVDCTHMQPFLLYSNPGQTTYRCYRANGTPCANTNIRISGHIWGW